MALKNKYQREKQQYSNDGGMTWLDVSPAKYRRGRLLEAASEDCNTIEWREVLGSWFCIEFEETEYRWVVVDGQYECVGYDKHTKEKKQQSTDGGTTWTDVVPLETKAGSLIQANSEDCGYVPPTPGGYENQYLTFEAIEDGTFTFTSTPKSSNSLSYSLDGGQTWIPLASGSASPTVTSGNKIMWNGITGPDTGGIGKFSSTGTFNAYGNIMSIVHGDNFQYSNIINDYQFMNLFSNTKVVNAENLVLPSTTLQQRCYQRMFYYCTSLTTAPALPATTLANYCYNQMFLVCPSLVNAPELPATTLADYCYNRMFEGCKSLTTAPVLPATTLARNCYGAMFTSCTSLTTAPVLPATTLTYNCYDAMFVGCRSLTTAPALPATTLTTRCYYQMFGDCTSLVNAPELPATTLESECYSYMFNGCTSLVTAPQLPVTTLATGCYEGMFDGCTSLVNAPELPATTLVNSCYRSLFRGCSSLVNAPELPATTLVNSCYQYMFEGCTGLTTAPVLPATTLASQCYIRMFKGCSNLNYIKAMFTTKPSTSYTENWVKNVASSGTFVKNSAATWDVSGDNGIPEGWTIQNA